jgi:hypothetical protein
MMNARAEGDGAGMAGSAADHRRGAQGQVVTDASIGPLEAS